MLRHARHGSRLNPAGGRRRPQAEGIEVQTEQEQQKHDPDMGYVRGDRGVFHQTDPGGPEQDAQRDARRMQSDYRLNMMQTWKYTFGLACREISWKPGRDFSRVLKDRIRVVLQSIG